MFLELVKAKKSKRDVIHLRLFYSVTYKQRRGARVVIIYFEKEA